MERSYKPEEFSLKKQTRNRILQDMIQETKINNPSISSFILIVDMYSLKVLSKAVNMGELVREGVLSVENLTLRRKPYPNTAAIYFIQPFAT